MWLNRSFHATPVSSRGGRIRCVCRCVSRCRYGSFGSVKTGRGPAIAVTVRGNLAYIHVDEPGSVLVSSRRGDARRVSGTCGTRLSSACPRLHRRTMCRAAKRSAISRHPQVGLGRERQWLVRHQRGDPGIRPLAMPGVDRDRRTVIGQRVIDSEGAGQRFRPRVRADVGVAVPGDGDRVRLAWLQGEGRCGQF